MASGATEQESQLLLPSGTWLIEGLIAAPTLLDQAMTFMDCTIVPPKDRLRSTPIFPGALSFQPTGDFPSVNSRPAEFEMTGAHVIATQVQASDCDEAFKIGLERFQRCAMALVITARVPAGGPIFASPEALVQVTLCYGPDGSTTGAPQSSKFGPIMTRPPTTANRTAAGFLDQVVGSHPELLGFLEHAYLADERAFLAFSRTDEEHALVEYCKVLEMIAGQVAREHKDAPVNRAGIEAKLAVAIETLRQGLDDDAPIHKHAELIRKAQLAIAAANLESQKKQIVAAGSILEVPVDILEVVDTIWRLRSSSASHAGGTVWSNDALPKARAAMIVYLSHFIVSRHLRDSGISIGDLIKQSGDDSTT